MLKNVKRASQRKRLRGSALGCEIDRAVQWDRAPQYRRSVRVGMDLEKAKCQDFYPFLCLASFLYLIKNSEQGKDDSIWRIPRDASLTTVFFFFFSILASCASFFIQYHPVWPPERTTS